MTESRSKSGQINFSTCRFLNRIMWLGRLRSVAQTYSKARNSLLKWSALFVVFGVFGGPGGGFGGPGDFNRKS